MLLQEVNMKDIKEKGVSAVNGWIMVAVDLAGFFFCARHFVTHVDRAGSTPGMIATVLGAILVFMTFGGFFLIHPNESKVFTFLGKYVGSARTAGFFWTNPFVVKKKVTLRIFNFNSETIKVNDALGNPIEIAAVVVWHVVDSAKALFNVDSYQNFVAIQSETAIRQLATHYPYDAHDKDTESLRTNPDEIAGKLKDQVQNRLDVAGLHVVEARLSHLAYAPEIAQAMLRRQQAEAIIAARAKIVDGAVGMVEMALRSLEAQGVVKLDEDKKAAMVNNLLVALVSETEMHPIINTGTLYS
jgi:regulator of protease activity HflC (stomatin/prohibitin superfamily)